MARYLKLLWLFARVSVQDNAAYRMDFIVQVIVSLLHFGAELVGMWTIFSNTKRLGDWGPYEFLVLLGVFRVMSGVVGFCIAPNMRLMMEEIRDGKLDYAIIKPVNTQFFISFRRIVVWRFVDIILGTVFIAFGSTQLSASMTAGKLLLFVLMLAAGMAIIYSFWLGLTTMAFWFTRISNIEMVFWNVYEAGRYPVDIYRCWVRRALTYVIPLAFLTTFPAGSLVGKTAPGNVLAAVLVACAALTLSSLFWQYGLRNYSGASA